MRQHCKLSHPSRLSSAQKSFSPGNMQLNAQVFCVQHNTVRKLLRVRRGGNTVILGLDTCPEPHSCLNFKRMYTGGCGAAGGAATCI